MQTTLKQTIATIFAISALTACQDYIPFWDGENYDKDLGHSADEFPDFNTTKGFTLNINYGKKGARALINIYSENPTYIGADGEVYFREEAEFKVFLDNNGRFKGNVVLPADTRKVWAYTARMNVPELMSEEVDGDGEVTIESTEGGAVNEASTPGYDKTNAENDMRKFMQEYTIDGIKTGYTEDASTGYKVWTVPRKEQTERGKGKTFSIVNWAGQRFGRIIPTHYYDTNGVRHNVVDDKTFDNQGLIENLADVVNAEGDKNVLGTADIELIQHFLWNGCSTKPESDFSEGGHYLNNRKYYKNIDSEDINTVIPYKYIDNGEVKTVKEAQVWLRFLGEGAHFCDGIGYYYYETGYPPKSQADIKAYYVAIPNTSSTASYEPEENTYKGRTVPFITYQEVNDKGEKTGVKTDVDSKFEDGDKFTHYSNFFKFNESTGKYEETTGYGGGAWTWFPKYVPFDINQKVQLLYHDIKAGTVSQYFPPGITIGFFLIYNEANTEGHLTGTDKQTTMYVDDGSQFFHSDWRVNEPQWKYTEDDYDWTTGEGKKGRIDAEGTCIDGTTVVSLRHFIALNYNNFAIYGVEDGVDCSMGDVLFAIETDPVGIVVNDDRVTIDEEMVATTTNHRTYAFEDIWPDGGDYDMNDVVIDHHHRMTIKRDGDGNVYNDHIIRIEDDFTPIQPEGSADYVDAFGIQIPNRRVQDSHIQSGENTDHFWVEKDGEKYTSWTAEEEVDVDGNVLRTTIILFKNAKADDVRYHKFTVYRKFDYEYASRSDVNLLINNTQLEQGGMNVLNPFIISQSNVKMGSGRHEIHLPKHSPTQYGLTLEGGTPPQYYVGKSREGKEFPFAVSVPKSAFSYPWGQHFTNLEMGEDIEIDDPEAYPDFAKWVEATDSKEKDWYSGWYKYLKTTRGPYTPDTPTDPDNPDGN